MHTRFIALALFTTLTVSAFIGVPFYVSQQIQLGQAAYQATQGTRMASALNDTTTAYQVVQATDTYQHLQRTQTVLRATEVDQDRRSRATAVALGVQKTLTALPTATPLPTYTALPTSTPRATATPASAQVNVEIVTCDTGVEVMRGTGEVTHVYVKVANVGTVDVRGVQLIVRASDEGDVNHPDQVRRIQYLPAEYGTLQRLAVDTRLRKPTSVQVFLLAQDGVYETTSRSDCQELDEELTEDVADIAGIVGELLPLNKLSSMASKLVRRR